MKDNSLHEIAEANADSNTEIKDILFLYKSTRIYNNPVGNTN